MSNSIDKSNLAQVIRDFPKQFAEGLRLAAETKISARGIREVLVAGVGGSALPADLLADYLSPEIDLKVSRGYVLHPKPNPHTLVFINSFSGNTEETLAAYEEALEAKVPMVAISHGGKLAEKAREDGVPHVQLPEVIQPRFATGLFFSVMAGILEQAGAIIDRTKEIEDLGGWLGNLDLEESGKEIAKKIGDKVPFIYSSNRFRATAMIWKIKINENAKTQCFYHVFPEMNHNEMVGFTNLRLDPAFVVLRSETDHPRVQKRMKVFRKLMEGRGQTVVPVDVPPGSFVFQSFATMILGDWVSYHMAIRSKTDPTPVDMVEDFKLKMTEA